MENLDLNPRDGATGKGEARKLRAAGRVPGVIYSRGGAATSVSFDPRTLTEIFRVSGDRNTTLNLALGTRRAPALVGEVQRHPLTRQILHVDFLELQPGQMVTASVPVTTSGKPEGASLGGRVQIVRRALTLRCEFERLPKTVDLDVTPLNVGDTIRRAAVTLPEGVKIIDDGDFIVVELIGNKRAEAEPAAAAPAAAGGKAPAAAAAKAPAAAAAKAPAKK